MDSLSSPITQIESAVEGYRLALQDAFTQRTDRTGAYEPETDPVLGDTLGRLKLLQSVILNDNTYRDGRAPVDDVRQRIRMDLKNAVFKR